MRISIRLFLALALVLSSVAGAHAQELLTTDDGISLRGTVRLLQGNAATCNVLQANEPSYEEMRVNQDQPLHLWELEFSVFNGSGRALDQLIAYYDISSPWPPCTNWTEQYEGLGYYEWADPSGRIQHTGASIPTLPNQTHTETIRVLAFNGVRPQFTDWSVNYTFLVGATATVATAPVSPIPAGSDSFLASPPINEAQDVFFGDDTSDWANDGECDDPRFEGPGTADTLLEEDIFRDATDCRTLLERGQITLAEAAPAVEVPRSEAEQDTSPADESECTLPRLVGIGTVRSSLNPNVTMRFAETHYTTTMSVGGQSTTIESEILGVDSDSITYRLVGATSTAGDVPIRNPGPHTVDCRYSPSGDILFFGDGSWS